MARTSIATDLNNKDTWAVFDVNIFQKDGEDTWVLVAVAERERYNNHPGGSTQQYSAEGLGLKLPGNYGKYQV